MNSLSIFNRDLTLITVPTKSDLKTDVVDPLVINDQCGILVRL